MREDDHDTKCGFSDMTVIVDSGKNTIAVIIGAIVLAFIEKGVGGEKVCAESVESIQMRRKKFSTQRF